MFFRTAMSIYIPIIGILDAYTCSTHFTVRLEKLLNLSGPQSPHQ